VRYITERKELFVVVGEYVLIGNASTLGKHARLACKFTHS